MVMSTSPIEKFPDSGVSHLVRDGHSYGPEQWPGAVNLVRNSTRQHREAAIDAVSPLALSPNQSSAITRLAQPAIAATVADILGIDEPLILPDAAHVSLLTKEDFEEYHGRWAGVYSPGRNQITINQGGHLVDTAESLARFIKIFMHEDFHYLSDQSAEIVARSFGFDYLQILRIGFMTLGEDLRAASLGQMTWDYYLAPNEAITEMLAIDAYARIADHPIFELPGGGQAAPFNAYPGYRDMVVKVMSDAIDYRATRLSRRDLWRFIGRGYLTGDLRPLMQVVHATYPGLSMREFGLITRADELPQRSDFVRQDPDDGGPDSPGPWTVSPEYRARLRGVVSRKPRSDYETDVVTPPDVPPSREAVRFLHTIRDWRHDMMREAELTYAADRRLIDRSGTVIHRDLRGNTIHYDQTWLSEAMVLMLDISQQFRGGAISIEEATEIMDQWLFANKHISELSSGFEEFFVVKHRLLDRNTSAEDFKGLAEETVSRIKALRQR